MRIKTISTASILIFVLLTIIFIFSSCTITLPGGQEISIDTTAAPQEQQQDQQEGTQEQSQSQEQNTDIQQEEGVSAQNADIIFLIITIVSFVIALVSAIFGFRKEGENTAGKILFTIFIVVFLVMLILYILSVLNII